MSGLVVDETTGRGYPLPHRANDLIVDVERIRASLQSISGDVDSLDGRATSAESRLEGLESAAAALDAELDTKAALSHSHGIGDVVGLSDSLASKSDDGHTHVASDITDSTSVGRAVLTAADATAARAAIGAGTGNGDVTLTGTQTLSNKTLTAPESTGAIYDNGSVRSNIVDVASGTNFDLSLGNYFIRTVNGNVTFTVSNVPASRAYAFTVKITHTSGTITWFSGVVWPGGVAPTLTTGRVHLFTFVTDNGGTTWRAVANVNYTS